MPPSSGRRPRGGRCGTSGRPDASRLSAKAVTGHAIELEHPNPSAADVREGIEKAFKRNAKLDADDLDVSTSRRRTGP
jgi:hypothetical protein